MVRRRLPLCLAFAAVISWFALVPISDVLAQTYRFSVDRNVSRVIVNRDASVEVEYFLTFSPVQGSSPIDIVDVGMPSKRYDLNSVTADIDGSPVAAIRRSEYVDPGVEVHLGSRAIRPGRTGTLHLRARVADMVFQDDDDQNYASVQFSPTWYSPDFTRGTTQLEVSFIMPAGVQPDEPRYHNQPFTTAQIEGDRVVYTWVNPQASPSRQYTFGASFPKRYVDRVVTQTFDFGEAIGGALACILPLGVIGLIVGSIVVGIRSANRRKLDYMPPTVSVEGVEIRRGLTAPEAAVLMELPLDKVLTLIAFGLVRKGAMRVVSRKPLLVEQLAGATAQPEPYETAFLAAIQGDGRLREAALRAAVVELVKGVTRKMRGFSGRQTVAYYRSIIAKAWERVEGDGEADLSEELLAETVEWTSLDENFEERAPSTWGRRTFRRPIWWGNYFPGTYYPAPRPMPSGDASTGGRPNLPEVNLPTLPGSEFASNVVGGLQDFANNVVGNVESFTAGVTQETNPPPPPPRSSRGGSSGGGCACACACAGCACACAGGGR